MKRGLIFCTVALFLVACSQGGTNKSPREGVMPGGPGAGFGPGISVDEALKSKLKEPLLVNGWLFVSPSSEVRLCSSLTGSQPPDCVQPSLAVKGLELTKIEGLRKEGGRAWSESNVQLLGMVSGGSLTVSPNTKG